MYVHIFYAEDFIVTQLNSCQACLCKSDKCLSKVIIHLPNGPSNLNPYFEHCACPHHDHDGPHLCVPIIIMMVPFRWTYLMLPKGIAQRNGTSSCSQGRSMALDPLVIGPPRDLRSTCWWGPGVRSPGVQSSEDQGLGPLEYRAVRTRG